jgi:hypothetical protein
LSREVDVEAKKGGGAESRVQGMGAGRNGSGREGESAGRGEAVGGAAEMED